MHLKPVNVRSSRSAKYGCAKRVETDKMVKPPEAFFKKHLPLAPHNYLASYPGKEGISFTN